MASITAASSIAASSFVGQQLKVQPTKRVSCSRAVRAVPTAKYGDESVYFDLKDLKNTTGQWDVYGTDSAGAYNGLQSKFFEVATSAYKKRDFLYKFLLLGGASHIAAFSYSFSKDVLAIGKGPQNPPTPGPRGKI
eukprot:TRINITY_DN1473_c0_g1_i2.p1 TRINITY_DN1473_c0_g1~~TRINITY_DN1473_c0_g1_i2.p1  ORF type:complete len:136 (-),score=40.39 TRINITY_DN1473_c0_g1_i2:528-935(-)